MTSLPYLDVKFLIFSYACCFKSGMERTAFKYVYLPEEVGRAISAT